jgi:K+-sensing histidine kinase KdpD
VLTVQVVALRGVAAGLAAAVVGAAAFSYFYIEPRGDLVLVGTRDEVLALGVFVAVASTAAILLHRAQRADRAAVDAGARADRAASEAQASARRAALFASVGHDLRTPLAGIRAGIDALTGPTVDDPAAREALRLAIAGETRRIERVLERILQVARLDTGSIKLEAEPIDVVGIVQACVARVDPDKRCALGLQPPARPVVGDPVLLEQAVGNVVENALLHGGDGPVEISGATRTHGYLLTVRDYGRGADFRLRAALEAPLGAPARDRTRSTGLGLQITRTIMEAHGGRVRCRPASGGGAVVEMEVPER